MNTRTRITALIAVALGFLVVAPAFAQTTISTQMGLCSQGSNVTMLQKTLATEPLFYPEGIVSGYYGSLTAAAVSRFQAYFGLPAVGRVGPLTLAKLNAVTTAGGTIDIEAPIIATSSVTMSNNVGTSTTGISSNTVSIQWTTNEPSTGKVYYSTSPLSISEASVPETAPGISGSVMASSVPLSTGGSVALSGLSAATTYYYSIVVADSSGNVSMTWPATFKTNQ